MVRPEEVSGVESGGRAREGIISGLELREEETREGVYISSVSALWSPRNLQWERAKRSYRALPPFPILPLPIPLSPPPPLFLHSLLTLLLFTLLLLTLLLLPLLRLFPISIVVLFFTSTCCSRIFVLVDVVVELWEGFRW